MCVCVCLGSNVSFMQVWLKINDNPLLRIPQFIPSIVQTTFMVSGTYLNISCPMSDYFWLS